MSEQRSPSSHYRYLNEKFPTVLAAVENLGQTVHNAGPLDRKTAELIQLAAAAATQSTGSVRPHARQGREAGAGSEEIEHALLLLISTIGFPKVAAALAWIREQ